MDKVLNRRRLITVLIVIAFTSMSLVMPNSFMGTSRALAAEVEKQLVTKSLAAEGTQFNKLGTFSDKYIIKDEVVYSYKGSKLKASDLSGNQKWEYTYSGGDLSGEIWIQDENIYIGTKVGKLLIISSSDGKIVKQYAIAGTGDITSGFTSSTGDIYAIRGGYLYCYRSTGVYKWKTDSYYDDLYKVVYVGENFVIAQEEDNWYYPGTMVWYSLGNGDDLGSISGYNVSNPIIDLENEMIYTNYNNDDYIYGYNLNNREQKWYLNAGSKTTNYLSMDNDSTIFLSSKNGPLYAIDSDTHQIKWKFDEGAPTWGRAVADKEGNIYVGQDNDDVSLYYLYKLNPDGEVLEAVDVPVSAADLHIREDGSLWFVNKGTAYSSSMPKTLSTITINQSSLDLKVGATSQLKVTARYSDGTEKDVTSNASWSSSEKSVATVNSAGLVTAEGTGSAAITASFEGKSVAISINVSLPVINVTGVSLDKRTLSLSTGNSPVKLAATVTPSNATNKNINWSSSDEDVAVVDDNGLVTPVGVGTANIIVTTVSGNKSATCTVTVQEDNVAVISVTLDKTTLTLTQGGAAAVLKATVNPSGATNKNVTWNSSNVNVATVDSSGAVTPIGVGTAAITVKTADGNKTASCSVVVNTAQVTEKTVYTLSELMDDEDAFNDILGKFTLDELKVVTPKAYILEIKMIQNDSLKVSQFEVTGEEGVSQVKVVVGTKVQVLDYKGDGVYKSAIYNLAKGSEVIINAYDKNGKLLDSNVQRLRTMNYIADVPESTEYTLEELITDLDVFNQILSLYTLDQINLVVPLSYLEDIQIKYSSILTAVTVYVKNGANKVEFETPVNELKKIVTMKNLGNGKFEGSLAGVQLGAEMKVRVYKDGKLVDDAVRKVIKN
jgi:uncharacterized protein YjdB